jgi:hypothetical protein
VGLAISVSGSLRNFQQKLLPANLAIPWLAILNESEENKIQLAEYAGVSIQKDLLIYCGCCRNVILYHRRAAGTRRKNVILLLNFVC